MNMPNLDNTGPLGAGPMTGRGLGRGVGRGLGRGVRGFGRGLGRGIGAFFGRGQGRPLGSDICTCPKCGYEESHKRATPCTQTNCPKCQTPMRGVNCL